MISLCYGDFFDFEAYSPEAIVVPVNCRGVSGAGLAKAAKAIFPESEAMYSSLAKRGLLEAGKILLTSSRRARPYPLLVIYFATKCDWRDPSRLDWIESGLADLANLVVGQRIGSIALPALGCGLGGLPWDDVGPLIDRFFASDPRVHVYVFPP